LGDEVEREERERERDKSTVARFGLFRFADQSKFFLRCTGKRTNFNGARHCLPFVMMLRVGMAE